MNTTIISINDNTINQKVRDLTERLISWRGKRVRVEFVKKDGSNRKMVIIPRNAWNEMNGLESTQSGRKMVATKCDRNMATVTEILEEGKFQPRTLNLATVTVMELA